LADSSAFFDIDNDGFAEWTEWAAAGEGLLAVDSNNNNIIENVSELFGDDMYSDGYHLTPPPLAGVV
jgi:hypothetical protein